MLSEIKAKLKSFMPLLCGANEPWLVGGAIRDAILELPLRDFDFAVKGSGVEFAHWFAKRIKGSFVLLDEKNDEARVVYQHKLTFDFNGMKSIKEDLGRRDFTLNAMGMKLPKFELLDPFNGMRDITKKHIRMVSEKSLITDALRILRGFRFKASLGFSIMPKTLKAIHHHKSLLQTIAPERIKEELFLLLGASETYQTLRQMVRLEVLDTLIPEIKPMRDVPQGKPGGNLLYHSLLTVKKVEGLEFKEFRQYLEEKKPILKLAALLHDIGKPSCYSEDKLGRVHFYGHENKGVELVKQIGTRLRLSNRESRTIETLIKYHMRPHLLASERVPTHKAVWRLVRDGGNDVPGLFLLAHADALASGGRGKRQLLDLIIKGMSILEELRRPKFKPLLTGNDLIAIGLKPGPQFKEILQSVEEAQVNGDLNTKEEAIHFVHQFFDRLL